MTALTDQGFQRDDLATILANMTTAVLAIYPDASLDPATKDGQLLGLFSNSIDTLGQVIEAVYDSGSPSTASGVTLARIVEYNGIQIINGTQSQVDLTFSGTVGAPIPMGTQLKCSVNQTLWYTTVAAVIGANGTVVVAALSQDVGAIAAPTNTITTLVMPLYGVPLVTNLYDALLGKNRETDPQLRLRRSYSTATPSQSILEGIKGAVANLPQVLQVETYENKTDLVDANGLPPHSMEIVVDGGADADIAAAIFLREPVGTGQVGDVTVTVTDSYGSPHPVTFQRPPVVSIWIEVDLTPLTGWSDALIPVMQQNIVTWAQQNWRIGTPVVRSQLYIPVNQSGTSFAVLHIKLGTAPGNVAVDDMIPIGFNQIAQVNTSQISVVKV